MSDDLAISSGGAIAVDADDLRQAADDLAGIRGLLEEAVDDVDRARRFLGMAVSGLHDAQLQALRVRAALEQQGPEADRLVTALRTAAAAYDLIELRVERDAALARGGRTAADYLDARIAALSAEYPEAVDLAGDAVTAQQHTGDPALTQLVLLAAMMPVLFNVAWLAAAIAGVRATGLGRIPRDPQTPLRVPAPPMTTVPPSGPAITTPPATRAAAVGRIPSGGEARVRVERYDLPDGTRAFAVYVTGTQAFLDRLEWMNMPANVQLFTRQDAASLAAVRAALEAAGARPGDSLFAFGHSQGGMIVDALAAEGTYRTEVLGTVGSPTSYDAPPDTLSVELRHHDDPVAALADGGHPQQVGAAGSFVAERTADPAVGPQDLTLAAHQLDTYLETAALVDDSGDPRVDRLQDRRGVLAPATRGPVPDSAPTTPPTAVPAPTPQESPVPELTGEVSRDRGGAAG